MRKRILSCLLAACMVLSLALSVTGCSAKTGAPALWKAGDTRNKIVVVSDVHLGIDDRYSETLKNRTFFIEFLRQLQSTTDVRELVLDGDFLDDWFLPVYYPTYTDVAQFYKDAIATNQAVFDELNNITKSGIKLVYIPGNHDMTLAADILQEAVPNIVQVWDADGLGLYYTGDRNEIAIEHGHRYDVFSAPDTVTNAELAGNDDTILPAGYFYARYGATWVSEGRPQVERNLPVITKVPDKSDVDQYGAYMYYQILKSVSERLTINEGLEEKVFDMRIAGFNDAYTYLDFYPAQQADGTISAPVLFKNIQRTWAERQAINKVKIPTSFLEAVAGTLDGEYFFNQAKAQYLDNPDENVDVVVFGHTHIPEYKALDNGKYYVNEGTWIDDNTRSEAERTFAVITTGEKTAAGLYQYEEDGSVTDIAASVGKAKEEPTAAGSSFANVSFATQALANYGDASTQARYVEVGGLGNDEIQAKLNAGLKAFCLAPTSSAGKDTTYDIMPVFEVVGGDLLSIRTYNTAYTAGAAYPVNSLRTQLFSLTTGAPDAVNLWDLIKDKGALKQLILDGKFGFAPAGVDGALPAELKAAAYKKLAESIDTAEFATQFYFGDGGRLNLWCDGDNHATGDYWEFDIPVTDLANVATDRLLPIIDALKNLGN
jgi:Uncharacterized protein conserved in bacteria